MPVPTPSQTIAVRTIRFIKGTGTTKHRQTTVGQVATMGGVTDQITSMTLQPWEVKPNEFLGEMLSFTISFDSAPDITLWVPPATIEWLVQA